MPSTAPGPYPPQAVTNPNDLFRVDESGQYVQADLAALGGHAYADPGEATVLLG